jgi:large subunit ribosomal protein L24
LPIHVSNVAVIDPVKNVPTRVRYRFESGKKARYAKKSGTTLDISK